jgi:hypothetical protein
MEILRVGPEALSSLKEGILTAIEQDKSMIAEF